MEYGALSHNLDSWRRLGKGPRAVERVGGLWQTDRVASLQDFFLN